MRRFPIGNSAQSRCGFSAAFPRPAPSFRGFWRWLSPRTGDFLRRGPLARGGGSACESPGDRRAQRSDAVAGYRSSETLPRRVRAGNLAYSFHGARQGSGAYEHPLRWRGSLQRSRFDSRRRAGDRVSGPETADCEYRRRNKGRCRCSCASEGRIRDSGYDKSPYEARSLALAQARSAPKPGHRARRLRRSLRSPALVAQHQWRSRRGARSPGAVERLGWPASASGAATFDFGAQERNSSPHCCCNGLAAKPAARLPRSKGRFSEKEKALPPRRQFLLDFRHIRKLPPLERRERIVVEQSAGLLFSKPLHNDVVHSCQTKRPASRIVRVAGHEMNEPFADPPQRILLRAWAEVPGQRAPRHLSEAALACPLFQALWQRAQNAVAFRMGNHGPHTAKLNLVQGLVHRGWDRKLVELHKKEITLVDAILPRFFPQRF